MSEKKVKKSLLSWIFTFAGKKKPIYFVSVFFAILRVACGMAPYILIANIVRELLDGVRDWLFAALLPKMNDRWARFSW